ncbi:MAG: DNA polymerase III subunit delta' [Hyphomicrobiaceae bacterium]
MARAPVLQETEAPPEADRLDGFPHPRVTARLHSHAEAQDHFAKAFAEARVHHAWLITGREGIGKATLAYRLARYVLAEPEQRGKGDDGVLSVPDDSIAARQVKALSHPGLAVLRRPYDTRAKRLLTAITVDEVRRLKSFLSHSAGGWRVVIVDRADDLNLNAANALLKSLEEPPARVLFVLISSQPGRLLTTIRSRCRRLDLQPLNEADLRSAATAALSASGQPLPPDADWSRLAPLAQGSVRRLLTLAGADGMKLSGRVSGLLSLLPKVDWPAVHALADDVSGPGSEQRFEQAFDLMMEAIARLIRARALGADAGPDAQLAQRVIPEHGLATWAELWETTLARKAETLALNLDRKILILETVARLQAASRGA